MNFSFRLITMRHNNKICQETCQIHFAVNLFDHNLVLEYTACIVCCSHGCLGLKILEGNLLTQPLVMERFMTEEILKPLHWYLNFLILYNLIFNCVHSITGRVGSQKCYRGRHLRLFMGPVEALWPRALLRLSWLRSPGHLGNFLIQFI